MMKIKIFLCAFWQDEKQHILEKRYMDWHSDNKVVKVYWVYVVLFEYQFQYYSPLEIIKAIYVYTSE